MQILINSDPFIPTRKGPTRKTIWRACRALITEAQRQGVSAPNLKILVEDPDARAKFWYTLDYPAAP